MLFQSIPHFNSIAPQAREVEKMYSKKLKEKKKEKKLVVGRKFSASGSGKQGHGVKFVDARTRSDKRGEQRAEKLRKKAKKGGSSKPKGPTGGGRVAKKAIVKKKHTATAHKKRH